ncbi:MAG: DUF4870 domain-containing protein [Bacteroidota bacterium]
MSIEENPAPEFQDRLSEHEIHNRQQEARSWAMLCHIAVFLAIVIPFGHVVGPLVIWLVKKDQYPLVDDQGKESLNFQLTMTIFSIILLIVIIVGLLDFVAGDFAGGIPHTLLYSGLAFFGLGITNFVFIIIAAVRSYSGEAYRYPISIHFVS